MSILRVWCPHCHVPAMVDARLAFTKGVPCSNCGELVCTARPAASPRRSMATAGLALAGASVIGMVAWGLVSLFSPATPQASHTTASQPAVPRATNVEAAQPAAPSSDATVNTTEANQSTASRTEAAAVPKAPQAADATAAGAANAPTGRPSRVTADATATAVEPLANTEAKPPQTQPTDVPDGEPAPPLAPTIEESLARLRSNLASKDAAVRLGAVYRLLRNPDDTTYFPDLIPLANDADYRIRRLVVEGLRRLQAPASVGVLVAALADSAAEVRATAWESLRQLIGHPLPFEPSANAATRAPAVARWREWWQRSKGRLTFRGTAGPEPEGWMTIPHGSTTQAIVSGSDPEELVVGGQAALMLEEAADGTFHSCEYRLDVPGSLWFVAAGGARWHGFELTEGCIYRVSADGDLEDVSADYSAWVAVGTARPVYDSAEQNNAVTTLEAGDLVMLASAAPTRNGMHRVRLSASGSGEGYLAGPCTRLVFRKRRAEVQDETQHEPANERLTPRRPAPPTGEALLPKYRGELQGAQPVRIDNPNNFDVVVGLRSRGRGKNFLVPAGGVTTEYVPDGKYQIFFVYSNRNDALFEGDPFTLAGNGVQISIVARVDGNYRIRQVK